MSNLDSKTLLELKELAKQYNIKNLSKLKKNELVCMLSKVMYEDEHNSSTNKFEKNIESLINAPYNCKKIHSV